jgi:hypothetical protein
MVVACADMHWLWRVPKMQNNKTASHCTTDAYRRPAERRQSVKGKITDLMGNAAGQKPIQVNC